MVCSVYLTCNFQMSLVPDIGNGVPPTHPHCVFIVCLESQKFFSGFLFFRGRLYSRGERTFLDGTTIEKEDPWSVLSLWYNTKIVRFENRPREASGILSARFRACYLFRWWKCNSRNLSLSFISTDDEPSMLIDTSNCYITTIIGYAHAYGVIDMVY